MKDPKEPLTNVDGSSDSPARGGAIKRLTRRGSVALFVTAVLVVVLGTVIGVEASHALSADPGSTTTTTTTDGSTTATTTGGGASSTTSTVTSGPTQTQAPALPTPGGAMPGHGSFNAVTCTSTSDCLAVGADSSGAAVVATTSNIGSSWSNQSVPSGIGPLDAVSCGDSQHCVAVGQGAIITSTDGGSSWTQSTVPTQNTTLLGVSCASATLCLASGVVPEVGEPLAGQLIISTDGGSTWTAATMPPATHGLSGIACPTATFCVAVGDSIDVSNDGGMTWTPRAVTGTVGPGSLRSVACASATQCVAVGANVDGMQDPTVPGLAIVTSDGGATWQAQSMPTSTSAIDQITCVGGSQCLAGGFSDASGGTAAFASSGDGGRTWQSQPPPSGLSRIAGLTCPAVNNCIAVGVNGTQSNTVSTRDGKTWSPTVVPQS